MREAGWERAEGRGLVAGEQHVRGPQEGQEKDSEGRVRESGVLGEQSRIIKLIFHCVL